MDSYERLTPPEEVNPITLPMVNERQQQIVELETTVAGRTEQLMQSIDLLRHTGESINQIVSSLDVMLGQSDNSLPYLEDLQANASALATELQQLNDRDREHDEQITELDHITNSMSQRLMTVFDKIHSTGKAEGKAEALAEQNANPDEDQALLNQIYDPRSSIVASSRDDIMSRIDDIKVVAVVKQELLARKTQDNFRRAELQQRYEQLVEQIQTVCDQDARYDVRAVNYIAGILDRLTVVGVQLSSMIGQEHFGALHLQEEIVVHDEPVGSEAWNGGEVADSAEQATAENQLSEHKIPDSTIVRVAVFSGDQQIAVAKADRRRAGGDV